MGAFAEKMRKPNLTLEVDSLVEICWLLIDNTLYCTLLCLF